MFPESLSSSSKTRTQYGEALEEIHTRADVDAGQTQRWQDASLRLRWELEPVGSHKQVNHGGSLPGFRAQLARFVDDKVTVVVLTNGDNANAARIALGVANFYISSLLPQRTAVKVDPKLFDAYAGQYQNGPGISGDQG